MRLAMKAIIVAASSLFFLPAGASAQTGTYPSGQVRIIVPLPPGGSTDFVARLLAGHLATAWKQSVIVENRVGGNAMLGPTYVAKSAPDGHTLLLGPPTVATAPATMKVLPIEPVKDLAAISQLVEMPNVITVNAKLPVNTLKELLAYAKANPGKLNSGTFAMGSQLTSGRFNATAGLNMRLVGYRGEALMMQATAGGEVEVGIATPITIAEHLSKGQIKALAVTSEQRLPALKDVPTTREAGMPEFTTTAWFGLFAPAGTPMELRRFISAEVAIFAKSPDAVAKLTAVGLLPKASTPEAMQAFFEQETKSAIETGAAIGLEKQ